MSFLKKLFAKTPRAADEGPLSPVLHEGYAIEAAPQREGEQFRLAGRITKTIGGEMKEHRLIRADLFSSYDEAKAATIRKAKYVITEQGDGIFG